MKSSFKRLFFFIVFISQIGYIFGSNSASDQAQSKVSVYSPISIENTDAQSLDFGVIAIGSENSTVSVSSTPSVIPNVSLGDAIVLNTITQTAAKFTVTGEAGFSYNISLPTSMTVSDGVNNLNINNFTSSNDTENSVIGVNDVFYIGADLNIPNDAFIGTYVGTFSIIVSYN